ncbi:hypothetical protein V8E53_006033, partial [Lactarius tabidus]
TDLQRHLPRWQDAILVARRCTRHHMVALTQLHCATAPSAADSSGMFFIPWTRPGEPNKGALDPQV